MSKEAEFPRNRRWITLTAWLLAVLSLIWVVVVWSPAFIVNRAAAGEIWGWYWAVDVLASFASPSMVVLALVGVGIAVFRRRAPAVLVLLALIAVWLLPLSVARLGRADRDGRAFRVLTYNSWTGSKEVGAKEAMFRDADADVIAILEPSLALAERYVSGGGVLDGYSSGWKPSAAWGSCPFLMSRFEVEPHDTERGEALRIIRRRLWDHFYRLEIVRTPTGEVAFVQMHARSPRGRGRWRIGLDQLLEVADIVREIQAQTGLPIVVVGDFNSPPTGLRARAFARRSGLVRAKPAMLLAGSYPSWMPAGVSLAIDGVYASPSVRVVGWRALGSAGSDHRAVAIDLVVDQLDSGSEP